ncbi:MAG TPA: hypothetical protein DCQ98_19915 [Planctomycetaceae bacterium]|nr:hypothetical protein [Planctomycetaceae bacterium]HRF00061.1 type III-B CRISPR module-associated protein Cmr5 [Pirellulaceae bacterium]
MSTARLTRSQRMAANAFRQVHGRSNKEARSFARSFPSLIHTGGLCQAIAYAGTKDLIGTWYLDALATILRELGHSGCADRRQLAATVYGMPMVEYVRLSRDALEVANYLKRFHDAEAADEKSSDKGERS